MIRIDTSRVLAFVMNIMFVRNRANSLLIHPTVCHVLLTIPMDDAISTGRYSHKPVPAISLRVYYELIRTWTNVVFDIPCWLACNRILFPARFLSKRRFVATTAHAQAAWIRVHICKLNGFRSGIVSRNITYGLPPDVTVCRIAASRQWCQCATATYAFAGWVRANNTLGALQSRAVAEDKTHGRPNYIPLCLMGSFCKRRLPAASAQAQTGRIGTFKSRIVVRHFGSPLQSRGASTVRAVPPAPGLHRVSSIPENPVVMGFFGIAGGLS